MPVLALLPFLLFEASQHHLLKLGWHHFHLMLEMPLIPILKHSEETLANLVTLNRWTVGINKWIRAWLSSNYFDSNTSLKQGMFTNRKSRRKLLN